MKRLVPEPHLSFSKQLRQIGNYIVDFSCHQKKLVVELDDGHHSMNINKIRHIQKQSFLEKEGYTVLYFWNNEIDGNINGVLENISKAIFLN